MNQNSNKLIQIFIVGKKGEFIFNDIKNNQKANLIMAVSPGGFIYYEINNQNTNSYHFRLFFTKLFEAIGEDKKSNYIFIMDNLPAHVSIEMKKFYQEKKINILTNVPYLSPFNLIELSFKKLKMAIYKKLYSNINEIIIDTKNILESENFKKNLSSQYCETLNEYISFSFKYFIYNNINKNIIFF